MRKAKKRKAPAKRKAKAKAKRGPAVLTVDLPPNLVPGEGTTCGAYIRSLLMIGKGTDEILGLVRKHYPESTAKGSDVSWNRRKLRDAGKAIPE